MVTKYFSELECSNSRIFKGEIQAGKERGLKRVTEGGKQGESVGDWSWHIKSQIWTGSPDSDHAKNQCKIRCDHKSRQTAIMYWHEKTRGRSIGHVYMTRKTRQEWTSGGFGLLPTVS